MDLIALPDTETLPTQGGSYLRQSDGSLLCADLAVDQVATATPAAEPAAHQE